jgi:hypothetical protein
MDATIGESMPSVERAFEGQPYHGFWGQVTVRAMLVAIVLAGLFSMVTLKIYMKVGVVGAFNMPINILSFVVLRSLVGLMRRCGIAASPFTRQENIFLQTSTITCINISLSCKYNVLVTMDISLLFLCLYKSVHDQQCQDQISVLSDFILHCISIIFALRIDQVLSFLPGGFGNYFVGLFTVVAKSLNDNPDKRDIVDVSVGTYGFFLLTVGMVAIMATLPLVQVT